MRIVVRGTVYPDVPTASALLGVSQSRVYSALCTGGEDRLGVGRGRQGRRVPGSRARPVTLGGVTYPSRRQASRALGVSRRRVDQLEETERTHA